MWWAFTKNSVVLTLVFFLACKTNNDRPPKIYLASSMVPLSNAIKNAVHEPIDLVFLSSSAIAKQIEHGAPCELAILADDIWRDFLVAKKLARIKIENFASNSLVLASVDKTKTNDVHNFLNSLAKDEHIIIADPDFVPLGTYTKEALVSLKLYEQFSTRMVRASSARQATTMLTERAAKYAVLYHSDALNDDVNIVAPLPATTHQPVRYPLVICTSAREQKIAPLIDALMSARVQNSLISLGFHQQ